MRRRSPAFACSVMIVALLAVACASGEADGFSLRSPQVMFDTRLLQADLDRLDGGINAATDQVLLENWATYLDPCQFLVLADSVRSPVTVGLYSTSDPTPVLRPILPAGTASGWYAACRVTASGTLDVYVFDQNNVVVGHTSYLGVDPDHFGFYVQGPAGTWYVEDARNAGRPQALAYAGTGADYGTAFLCFEDQAYSASTSTFGAVVLRFIQPIGTFGGCATPAHSSTWGSLKAAYR